MRKNTCKKNRNFFTKMILGRILLHTILLLTRCNTFPLSSLLVLITATGRLLRVVIVTHVTSVPFLFALFLIRLRFLRHDLRKPASSHTKSLRQALAHGCHCYWMYAVCDGTIWHHIRVWKPTFWRRLLTQLAYYSSRTLYFCCCTILCVIGSYWLQTISAPN